MLLNEAKSIAVIPVRENLSDSLFRCIDCKNCEDKRVINKAMHVVSIKSELRGIEGHTLGLWINELKIG